VDGGGEQARDLEHQARDLLSRRFRDFAQNLSLTRLQVREGLHIGRGFVKLHIALFRAYEQEAVEGALHSSAIYHLRYTWVGTGIFSHRLRKGA
jgi:hypothetical protein